MKISVVVPCYNSSATISDCIKSLIQNTPKQTEIVVVDDGSEDNSTELIETYIGRVKLIEAKHGGAAYARNVGIQNSSGDIIIFVDSDVIITEGSVSKLIEPLSDSDVVATQGSYMNLLKDNIVSRYEQRQIEMRLGDREKPITSFATYFLAIRRECLVGSGGFDERFKTSSVEDTMLSYRVGGMGKILYVPSAKVYHRHRSTVWSYMRKQFTHSKNRAMLYRKYPKKVGGDTYTTKKVMIQPVLAFLSLFVVMNYWVGIIAWDVLALIQLDDTIKVGGVKLRVVTYFLNLARAYVWFFGAVVGVIGLLATKK